MDQRLLQSFVAVAEELHFGRAAKRLNISQPPLTKQIQQLEQRIGAQLLTRTKRSVELTPAGRVLLEQARDLLARAEHAAALARKAERGESGHLSIGFIDAAIYSVVPQIVERFAARYPDVTFDLADMRIPEQIRAVTEGRLDVGFVHPPVAEQSLRAETILSEPLIAALPRTHRLANLATVPLAELAGEPLVQFPRGINPELYDEIIALCRASGFDPRIVRVGTPKQTIIGLVSVGLGVSLLPKCIENLRRDGVVYRPIDTPLTIETCVISRRDAADPPVAAFLAVVRECARDMDNGGGPTEASAARRHPYAASASSDFMDGPES